MRARELAASSGLLALLLLPKCPLCFAALFLWAGASGSLAYDVAPLVRPILVVTIFVAALVVARRRKGCCATSSRTAS